MSYLKNNLDVIDSLALFCTSKKFSVYQQFYSQLLLDVNKGIGYCVAHGKLDSCKFLYSRNQLDIHGWIFEISCENGCLEISKWLIKVGL